MDYIGVPRDFNYRILGWVNMGDKRYVIVKLADCYYRAEYITELKSEVKQTQITSSGECASLTHIKCRTYNRGDFSYSPDKNDVQNTKLYEHLVKFKRESEIPGQIYY